MRADPLPSFKFRLAAVLRLRERVQEEKELELSALNSDYARREREMSALEAELGGIGADAGMEQGQIILPIELQLKDGYAQSLARRIDQRRRELAAVVEQRAAKQQELTEAARQVKSLDRLRQRAAENFRHEENRAEQKFLDEIGQRKGRLHE